MRLPTRPIWRPYTQEKTALPPLKISHAKGAYLFSESGERIFDGISSWWLITHGHCHDEIVEAVRAQVARLDQVLFANFSHDPAEQLAELLVQITPPQLKRVFYSDNGSTAVESALKMALQACQQKGFHDKKKFVAFEKGYHGDTVGSMSVSGESAFNKPYRPILFDVIKAKHPGVEGGSLGDYTKDFERLITEQHESLAGVIIEPLVQGAGGMIMWPKESIQQIHRLCQKYGVYLIFDEVMTGFGRTGKMFAMDNLGVTPDLLCLSKGLTGGTLPLAVTMCTDEIYEAFLDDQRARMFFHGHSFTGNPISCAAAVCNIKILGQRETLQNIELIEKVHQNNARRFGLNVRICGTIAAFEPLQDGSADRQGYLSESSSSWTLEAFKRGLFIRPLGETVYLMPPFCTLESELNHAWENLVSVVLK